MEGREGYEQEEQARKGNQGPGRTREKKEKTVGLRVRYKGKEEQTVKH